MNLPGRCEFYGKRIQLLRSRAEGERTQGSLLATLGCITASPLGKLGAEVIWRQKFYSFEDR
jgi:hypothetical protein